MQRIDDFKKAYERFNKAVKYMSDNEEKLKKDPARWEQIKHNFKTKFEQPLDAAWKALSKDEKKRFNSLYKYRKAMQDEMVRKVIKTFNGKLV